MTEADEVDLGARLFGARRIHVVGSSGAGKSRVANRLGTVLKLPVHHLDDVALDPESGSMRPPTECLAAARAIAQRPEWLSEGIYLGWTDVLLRSADTIIWLDTVSSRTAALRIVGRFLHHAFATARTQHGFRRIARFRDYRRQLRGLLSGLRETRRYHRADVAGSAEASPIPSRAATATALAPYRAKTVRCRRQDDLDRLMRTSL